ncbi:ribonuclease H2 subunit A [Phytophthora cinnamomi]|uniref:ribonuclease H2 subunit A n=1 Tax=Phytophthora cinnamomi TaxID=4785 RepID=UPI00355A8909|nr:ribonuclease H2 subunit A [Phytophthora cinnamomi]
MVVQECTLPVLPPTKWFAATEHNFLVQRQRLLENYLKGVSMVDELQDSVPLLVFLGVLSASYVNHVALRRHRRQILHLQILEYYTQPGDLILFNGRAKVSALQRSLTRAEWDHVAVVVPSRDKGHLQLLEATGDGVTLSPLTSRLLAYSTFHVRYFALRKLRTPLLSRAVVNDLLERFTAEVEGLSYGLSLRRLLHTRQASLSRDSTFFCSELVAQAYKALGIISSSVEANDFWPGSFSPGDFVDAELGRHGASLSPEVIIDCKLLEVATATKRTQSTLN